ncbi:dihydrolipoamide acetyltransferase component of pyruvate dehydrogenase complex [Spirochaetia bacterium]|nr:dihydrolipoamide acetyltransferase component of pyruvate dehydrogenase complex [Spirochaetia bacterium]
MAHVLIMPRQGNTVESCIIVNWKVKEGEQVGEETTVCEVETDKAAFEVPAGEAGVVLKILHRSGDDVPVLEPIAVIGTVGEDWQAILGGAAPAAAAEAKPESAVVQSAAVSVPVPQTMAADGGKIAASPRARNLAEKEALPLTGLPGTGPGGRIIERDVAAALAGRPTLTAAARAVAVGAVPAAGSGIGGRVTAADLAGGGGSAGAASTGGTAASGTAIPDLGEGVITETPIKGIRKVISDRMFKSLAESAQFTLNASAPVSRLQEIRSRMKASEGFSGGLGLAKITVNDLILFAVSRLLPRYPFMNAHKIGDTLRTFERVHLGVAVDTPRGLMVPVIRNANLLPLGQISSEAKRLAAACQGGGVRPDELSGSTFTVTNLGSLGITGFTPVLNAPEVAILGVCGIELKPVSDCNGEVRFEPHIGFSLTINHQVVDGAPAARFLKALGEAIADIDLLLAAG